MIKTTKRSLPTMKGRHRARTAKRAPKKDNCSRCHGERGGVPGNENIVNGVVLCDYCHSDDIRKEDKWDRLHAVELGAQQTQANVKFHNEPMQNESDVAHRPDAIEEPVGILIEPPTKTDWIWIAGGLVLVVAIAVLFIWL